MLTIKRPQIMQLVNQNRENMNKQFNGHEFVEFTSE